MSKGSSPLPKSQARSFTLIELVVVIIIIAILASLGFTQYNNIVEKARLTEARVRLRLMRTLAIEYYYKYGSMTGITNSDVGENNTCVNSSWFRYWTYAVNAEQSQVIAERCTADGKSPNAVTSYVYECSVIPLGALEDCVRFVR